MIFSLTIFALKLCRICLNYSSISNSKWNPISINNTHSSFKVTRTHTSMWLLVSLAVDEKVNFTQYCVVMDQVMKVVTDCKISQFNDTTLALINASLELNKTGWSFWSSESNPDIPPKQQMKAVGYAEGYIFFEQLANHQRNIKEYFLSTNFHNASDFPAELYQFFRDNIDWMREQSQKNRDDYWKQVAYTLAHFDGLVMGYQQKANSSAYLSEVDMMIYMASGDLLDVVKFALPDERARLNTPEMDELNDHCSGLVKIEKDEIYLSQVAWFTYGSMTRVSKEYKFNLGTAAKYVKFSSYPGFSYSFDDWYSTDTGFMYFETTESVYNDSFYDLCSEQSLLAWVRAPVAGRMARDGEHFSTIISKYNSGTYNNQWVIVDLKKFDENATHNVLWIQEQIPGRSTAYDATRRLLDEKYFPSYNNPSQLEIRQISGYPQQAAHNISKDYYNSSRAKIFKRDAPKVVDITSMKKLMRYNDYLHDPLSEQNGIKEPSNAIASRYDLRTDNTRKTYGAFDAKIGSYNSTSKKYQSHFISSPAYDDVQAFSFPSDIWCPRHGLPDGPYKHEWVIEDMPKAWK